MFTPLAFSSSVSCGRVSHQIAVMLLVLIKLVTSGCTALPGNTGIAHTMKATGSAGFDPESPEKATIPPGPATVPSMVVCRSQAEAHALGLLLAGKCGADLLITSGTNSMAPLIKGKAYVVVQYRRYDTINQGELLVYQGRPNAAKKNRLCMLHRAVLKDKYGWLMSGDHNRWSESWDRVTPVTYLGTVTTILSFPQQT